MVAMRESHDDSPNGLDCHPGFVLDQKNVVKSSSLRCSLDVYGYDQFCPELKKPGRSASREEYLLSDRQHVVSWSNHLSRVQLVRLRWRDRVRDQHARPDSYEYSRTDFSSIDRTVLCKVPIVSVLVFVCVYLCVITNTILECIRHNVHFDTAEAQLCWMKRIGTCLEIALHVSTYLSLWAQTDASLHQHTEYRTLDSRYTIWNFWMH